MTPGAGDGGSFAEHGDRRRRRRRFVRGRHLWARGPRQVHLGASTSGKLGSCGGLAPLTLHLLFCFPYLGSRNPRKCRTIEGDVGLTTHQGPTTGPNFRPCLFETASCNIRNIARALLNLLLGWYFNKKTNRASVLQRSFAPPSHPPVEEKEHLERGSLSLQTSKPPNRQTCKTRKVQKVHPKRKVP